MLGKSWVTVLQEILSINIEETVNVAGTFAGFASVQRSGMK
jgi:hypothetical protein